MQEKTDQKHPNTDVFHAVCYCSFRSDGSKQKKKKNLDQYLNGKQSLWKDYEENF